MVQEEMDRNEKILSENFGPYLDTSLVRMKISTVMLQKCYNTIPIGIAEKVILWIIIVHENRFCLYEKS